MQLKISTWIGFFLLIFLFQSCQMSVLLKENRNEMKRLAYADLSKKEKFDGLAEVLVGVLENSLELGRGYKSYRYINKFSKQNDAELQALSDELGPWIKQMGAGEKIAFTTRAVSRPYSKRLIQVVPKVDKMAKENGYKFGTIEKVLLLYKLRGLVK